MELNIENYSNNELYKLFELKENQYLDQDI